MRAGCPFGDGPNEDPRVQWSVRRAGDFPDGFPMVYSRCMKETRHRWVRPNFEERPLGAEVTAYLTSATPFEPK